MHEKRIIIVIPTYNEAGHVPLIVDGICRLGLCADILFVDDRSPDGTAKVAQRISFENPAVRVLNRPRRMGIGSAHKAGISFAYENGYDLLVTMDCDLAHDPGVIPAMIDAAENADIVIGSRFVEKGGFGGWGAGRRLLSALGHVASKWLLGVPFDSTGAFRLYRLDRIERSVFERARSCGYPFFFESLFLLVRHGARVCEVPIVAGNRRYGRSKMGVLDILSGLVTLFRLWLFERVFAKARANMS